LTMMPQRQNRRLLLSLLAASCLFSTLVAAAVRTEPVAGTPLRTNTDDYEHNHDDDDTTNTKKIELDVEQHIQQVEEKLEREHLRQQLEQQLLQDQQEQQPPKQSYAAKIAAEGRQRKNYKINKIKGEKKKVNNNKNWHDQVVDEEVEQFLRYLQFSVPVRYCTFCRLSITAMFVCVWFLAALWVCDPLLFGSGEAPLPPN
jgi:hypothetical protein